MCSSSNTVLAVMALQRVRCKLHGLNRRFRVSRPCRCTLVHSVPGPVPPHLRPRHELPTFKLRPPHPPQILALQHPLLFLLLLQRCSYPRSTPSRGVGKSPTRRVARVAQIGNPFPARVAAKQATPVRSTTVRVARFTPVTDRPAMVNVPMPRAPTRPFPARFPIVPPILVLLHCPQRMSLQSCAALSPPWAPKSVPPTPNDTAPSGHTPHRANWRGVYPYQVA